MNAENGTWAATRSSWAANTYSLTQGTDIIATEPFVLEGQGVGATTISGSTNSRHQNPFGELARILRVDSGAGVTIRRT